jgi:hypothetical protein
VVWSSVSATVRWLRKPGRGRKGVQGCCVAALSECRSARALAYVTVDR